jgi:5-methylcytosine-specific restriction endonuclease McrA
LKEKLLKDGLKEEKCELCGLSIWQGIKLPLELHHKNGNHLDNSYDNLMILCPNCHSIQDGNSGANVGNYTKIL